MSLPRISKEKVFEPKINKPTRNDLLIKFWREAKNAENSLVKDFSEILLGEYRRKRNVYIGPQSLLTTIKQSFKNFVKTEKILNQEQVWNDIVNCFITCENDPKFNIFFYMINIIETNKEEIDNVFLKKSLLVSFPHITEENLLKVLQDDFITNKINTSTQAGKNKEKTRIKKVLEIIEGRDGCELSLLEEKIRAEFGQDNGGIYMEMLKSGCFDAAINKRKREISNEKGQKKQSSHASM